MGWNSTQNTCSEKIILYKLTNSRGRNGLTTSFQVFTMWYGISCCALVYYYPQKPHSIPYHENTKYTFYSPYDHDCCQKALLRAIFLATLWNSQDTNISTQKCKIVFALLTPGADVKIRTIGETFLPPARFWKWREVLFWVPSPYPPSPPSPRMFCLISRLLLKLGFWNLACAICAKTILLKCF